MSKIANSYVILRVSKDGTMQVEKGGLKDAREAKKAATETAKASPGCTFVDAKIGIPIEFREITSYELVNPEIEIPGSVDGGDEKEDDKGTPGTTDNTAGQGEDPVEPVADPSVEEPAAEPAEVKPEVEPEVKDEVVNAAPAEAVSAPVEEAKTEVPSSDGSSFDELFTNPVSKSSAPSKKVELF